MDAKTLADTGKQISKASDSGDPPATILALLQSLDNFKATEDLLRQSKIGVIVTKLRTNKDPKVQETAARLVNRWKQEVKKKKGEGSPAPSNKAVNGAQANGRSSGTSSPAPQSKEIKKDPGAMRKSTVHPPTHMAGSLIDRALATAVNVAIEQMYRKEGSEETDGPCSVK